MKSLRLKSLLSCAIVLALLQGCGGNSGGSGNTATTGSGSGAPTPVTTPPSAPAVSADFGIKHLQYTWQPVAGATFYRVLEDADGSGHFTQVGGDQTATTFSSDIPVHTFNWAARYQVQACNSAGCSTSATQNAADNMLKAIGYFKASNTGSGDTFGWSLALSDDGLTLAVGAPSEDSAATGVGGDQTDNSSADSGAVYVFAKTSAGWQQQAYIKAPTSEAGANFGESVALSSDGNTLAVGAPFASNYAGDVYVYSRNGGTWSYQSGVAAGNAYTNSYFGWSVALNNKGDLLAVGAPGDSNSGTSATTNTHATANAGAVYVFTYGAQGWGSQVYLKAPSIVAQDNFGAAVALNGAGDVLAAGAPHKANGTGATYVFTASSGTWSAPAAVTAAHADAGDNFGAALALDDAGTTLAVGAPYEASNATGVNGSQTDNSAAYAGAAYIFTTGGNTWSQQAYVKASNTDSNDDFGTAVALSGDGNSLVVGAIGESSNATGINGNTSDNSTDGVGAAYLFQRNGSGATTVWTQRSYIKPPAATLGDEFGTAVGMSTDGGTLAVSGAFEQSNATGVSNSLAAQADTSTTDAGALWLF